MAVAPPTFFFYDLETSGIDSRTQRIMQFAGQRTDANLEPVGEPLDMKVALGDDALPDPYAVLVTGITPQQTREEGYSEAEFLKIFYEEVCTPHTTIVGFNNVRFDDEFMRFTLWRNFYDAYEWQWKDNCSRWDLLDAVRMTRALRPDGIKWPVDAAGAPTNRLELLTKENGLDHENAHDALSDVQATIDVARMLKTKQPKLFEYLYSKRLKRDIEAFCDPTKGQPFVYASGNYPKETLHTTVALPLAEGSRPGTVIVYDLRHDPSEWAQKSVDELKSLRFATREIRAQDGFKALPAKELACNKCPAVAPVGTLDTEAWKRIGLSLETVEKHRKLLARTGLKDKLQKVFTNNGAWPKAKEAEGALYDGFMQDADKTKMRALRSCGAAELKTFRPDFADERLRELVPRYKARNYPTSLTGDERDAWETWRQARLQSAAPLFAKQLATLAAKHTSERDQFLLQELQLWFENVMPASE